VASFAWSALRVFRNEEHTAAAIIKAHDLPEKFKDNARKQARQIRQCLIQAEEYARAAECVTSSTRPALQYYSLVSLATAEILFKGTGDLSLDKARSEHGHHGLALSISPISNKTPGAVDLVAKPAVFGSRRSGTFELWHRLSRPNPICGPIKTFLPGNQVVTNAVAALLMSDDIEMPGMAESGHSLLDCFVHIPGLSRHLENFETHPNFARCHISRSDFQSDSSEILEVNFHPSPDDVLESIYSRIACSSLENLSVIKYPNGRMYRFNRNREDVLFGIPNGVTLGDETYIWPYSDGETTLNYFGWLYVASYILGTYARYFPDKWMSDIERASYLATASDTFYQIAAAHAPLCVLSELSRNWMVPMR
jgi:hypothetical protein